jgi:hypothetical protein
VDISKLCSWPQRKFVAIFNSFQYVGEIGKVLIVEFPFFNEELHSLYSSQSIIRMIRSRRVRWAGHVARKEEKRNANRILVGKPEGKRTLGRQRRRGWTKLKWILERQNGMVWIGLIWLRRGTSGRLQ